MRKTKGFTLIEILTVIIILAIIMLITIPSVLSVLTRTNTKSFIHYYERVFNQAEKKYTEDIANSLIDEDACIIYSIKTELGFDNTGTFDGYVLIDSEGDKYITLFNNNYMVVAKKYDNNLKETDLKPYEDTLETKKTLSAEYLCNQSDKCDLCKLHNGDDHEEDITPINNITMLKDGTFVNETLKKLANPSSTVNYKFEDKSIKSIVFEVSDDTDGEVISSDDSKHKVYASYKDGIITIKSKAKSVYLNPDSSGIFYRMNKVEEIDLSHFDTKFVNNMSSMFGECNSLKDLDVTNFSTSNVTNMNSMFQGCSSLKNIDLSNFDTSNVTTMFYMFANCTSMTKLDLKSFDTSLVRNMSGMFGYNKNLEELDISSFRTSRVESFSNMFTTCEKLKVIDVSQFDTRNAKSFDNMFSFCKSVEELDFSGFITDNVTTMKQFLYADYKLKRVDTSSFKTGNVTDMKGMFYYTEIESLDLRNFDTSKVTDMSDMFGTNRYLTELNVTSFDTSKVKKMNGIFSYTKIKVLDLSSFDTSSLTNLRSAFYDMSELENIIIGDKWTTKNVTDFGLTFEGCKKLEVSFFKNIDTSSATKMNRMFSGYNTEVLDLKGMDTTKVFDMSLMFSGLNAKELRLDTFDFSNVQYHGGNPYYNSSVNGPMFTKINDDMVIYVKDEAAKTFVNARLAEAGKTNTVIIAS